MAPYSTVLYTGVYTVATVQSDPTRYTVTRITRVRNIADSNKKVVGSTHYNSVGLCSVGTQWAYVHQFIPSL